MKKSELQEALKFIVPCTDKVANALGTHAVVFTDTALYGFNDSIGCEYRTPTPLNTSIEAQPLKKYVDSFTGDTIHMTADDKVTFSNGRSKVIMPTYETPLLNRIRNILGEDMIWRQIPADFTRSLLKAVLPMNTEHKGLAGVYVRGNKILSTNRHIIYASEYDINVEACMIPMKVIPMLARHEFTEMSINGKWVFFRNATCTFFTVTMDHTAYPAARLQELLNAGIVSNVRTDMEISQDFVDSIKTAGSTESAVTTLSFREGSCTVKAKGVKGEYERVVEAPCTTEDYKVDIPIRKLHWLLTRDVQRFTIREGGPVCIVSGTDNMYMASMPKE